MRNQHYSFLPTASATTLTHIDPLEDGTCRPVEPWLVPSEDDAPAESESESNNPSPSLAKAIKSSSAPHSPIAIIPIGA